MAKRKSDFSLWVEGARLRTLPLAVAPIVAASGASFALQAFDITKTLLALAVALLLQVGVNYANDYSDGIRGTDSNRVGPLRLTASGSFQPKTVKLAAFIALGLGALAGLALIVVTGLWWLLAVGALAVVAAWFYTGGKKPYGYAGLGELVVFVFFGLVAVIGTVYVQAPSMFGIIETWLLVLPVAVGLGLYSSAVLMINNIRDIETDLPAGKKTLAVRVGKGWAKSIYLIMIWAPLAIDTVYLKVNLIPAFVFPFALIFLLLPLTLIVITAKTPRENILALKLTSYSALAYATLIALGLWKLI